MQFLILLLDFENSLGGIFNSSLISKLVCSCDRVVNQDLRPARQHARERVVAPVQRQMPDWLADLPEATRANAHLLIIWPILDYVEDDETE